MTRGKGEGSIFQRANGLWVGRIELPRAGKDRRVKEFTSKDKNTVIRKMTALRKQFEENGDIPSDKLTIEGWTGYWLREIAEKRLRPSAFASVRSHIRWIDLAVGTRRLDKANAATVRDVLTLMSNPPDVDGKPQKPASSTYKRNVYSTMSKVFKDAERAGRITRNPVELVDAPLRNRTSLEALTPDEAISVLLKFEQSPDAYLWATYLLTGARRGEILGLEWDRVTDVIDLSWQLQRISDIDTAPADYEYRLIRGGLYWTRPKSKAGWRIIPLVDPLKTILDRWRQIAPPNPYGLVFTRQTVRGHGVTRKGETVPLDPDYITRLWPLVRKAAEIDKRVRLHDIRHTTVDLLLAAGVPEDIVQEIVGHSTRAMTRQYKTRGNRERLTTAMKQLSASLGYPS
jgi:integrase